MTFLMGVTVGLTISMILLVIWLELALRNGPPDNWRW